MIHTVHKGKLFDVFAIKNSLEDGKSVVVGNLPREVPRACRFLLDRGKAMETNFKES